MPDPYVIIGHQATFRLHSGRAASMEDVVTVDDRARYVEEVKMIQMALGVRADGIIGPETRRAVAAKLSS